MDFITTTTKAKVIIGILSVLLLIATASSLYHWYKTPAIITQTEYVNVPQIKEVVKIKRVTVPGPARVVTVEKTVIVEKLGLPEWISTNDNEQAIATASIDPYKGKTNAVALLNVKTGVGQIVAKREPLPLFGFVNEREIGLRAGINTKAEPETTVYGKWSFARVGNAHIGIYGDASSTGQARVQVEVGFRF